MQKILFIDRDGTIIVEPPDEQVDCLEKLHFMPNVIPALLKLQQAGFKLVMISNQDGLGSDSFPQADFEKPHNKLMEILSSQGIQFDDVRICPHFPHDHCDCRKPKLGLIIDYLKNNQIDINHSYIIGDRETDVELAKNLCIQSLKIHKKNNWLNIVDYLVNKPRTANVNRKTKETNITTFVNLDQQGDITVQTGIGFFDHMLEQLAKHGGFSLQLTVKGDLGIDDHHTVEDTAIVIGEALRIALSDKAGIGRYGFVLPMDESLAEVAIDLSGRSYCQFDGKFNREKVGGLTTELIPHFFRSLADSLQATIHIKITGENTHHMIEAIFKAVGRSLRQAIKREDFELPTTKGLL